MDAQKTFCEICFPKRAVRVILPKGTESLWVKVWLVYCLWLQPVILVTYIYGLLVLGY